MSKVASASLLIKIMHTRIRSQYLFDVYLINNIVWSAEALL